MPLRAKRAFLRPATLFIMCVHTIIYIYIYWYGPFHGLYQRPVTGTHTVFYCGRLVSDKFWLLLHSSHPNRLSPRRQPGGLYNKAMPTPVCAIRSPHASVSTSHAIYCVYNHVKGKKYKNRIKNIVTLFIPIAMLCGTNKILWNIPPIQLECEEHFAEYCQSHKTLL